jgi:hypothetical protein
MGAFGDSDNASLLSAAGGFIWPSSAAAELVLLVGLLVQGLIYGFVYIGIWLLLPGGYREAKGMIQLLLKAKSQPSQ